MDSKFSRFIGSDQSIPLGLLDAKFLDDAALDADIFYINNPSPVFVHPTHLRQTFVTERFKETWEKSGLIGAQFTRVGELPDPAR